MLICRKSASDDNPTMKKNAARSATVPPTQVSVAGCTCVSSAVTCVTVTVVKGNESSWNDGEADWHCGRWSSMRRGRAA